MNRPADRMARIQPFRVMEILARARAMESAGRSIVHMEVGEPDFPTPMPIVEAGIRALKEGRTRYTPAVGLAQLREAISDWYRSQGAAVSSSRIIVTPGASGALQLVLGALINSGDGVLLTDPGYPCNRNFLHLLGGVPIAVPVGAASDYQLTAEHLEAAPSHAVAALIATPSNPTGTVLSRLALQNLIDCAHARGTHLIVDEIYQGLIYENAAPTALSLSDRLFAVNSFSKYFGMTGWRIGWAVAPEHFVGDLDKLAQNIFLAAPTPAQYAALAAFEPETLTILEQRKEEFRRRRDFLIPALREIGFDIPVVPSGAFYIYAGCTQFTRDSFTFADELLEKAGVAITPGIDFGEHEASAHVRFAYTTSLEQLEEGVERLRRYLGSGG